MTKSAVHDITEIENNAAAKVIELEEFRNEHSVPPSAVFNTDESGLNYESHGARTLSFLGEKNTEAIVQSVNATSHSYTIMPLISIDGKLHSPLMICHREASGQFGPQVHANLPKPPNMSIHCSKSGKLDKNLVKTFMQDVYAKVAAEKSILLIDSWSGHKDLEVFDKKPNRVKVFHIPEGATSLMQPLDAFFFHQWKDFVKRIQERPIID